MHKKQVHWAVFLVVFVGILFAGCTTTPSEPPSSLSDLGVGKLATLKTESEDWAKRIKTDYPSPSSAERKDAETKYIAARAAMDGWIAQFKVELAQGHEQPNSEEYQNALANATDKGQQFVDYVNKLYVRGAISSQSVSLIENIYDILSKVFNDVRDKVKVGQDARKKEVINILDSLKWKAFSEL